MKQNSFQDIIINSNDNYTLVIACPGSGKTFTLIEKYINLINNNILSEEIILITFTKKAGLEMNNRISQNNIILPYYVGSIHGLAYKILYKYDILLNYTIIDENNSTLCLLNIINNNDNLKLLDNNQKLNIINIIDKININYPIKTKNIDKDIKDIYYQYKKFKKKK